MKRRTVLQMAVSAPLLSKVVPSSAASGAKRPLVAADGAIFIGTHYEYPFGGNSWRMEWRPKSPADWRKDLLAIRDTGFNLIRIRVGFDSSLDDTRVLLDLAHELGLKVDYGFATFYAPDWFTQRHPEARMVTAEGEVLGAPRNRRWPRACIEHESYRKPWRELLEGSAQRFRDHPAIVLWDVHNEPGHVCYCDLSKSNFKQHLQRKYGDIQRVNAAWGTRFTDLDACTQIPRKSDKGVKLGAQSHYGEWRAYQTEVMSSFLKEGFRLIRAHVKDRPVTYNVVATLEHGSDWWTTQESDVGALSDYWDSNAWTTNKAVRLALLGGINPGKQLWVLETLGGAPPKTFMPTLWTGKHLELETWSFLGKGVKGIVQYRWEPILAENETLMFNMVDVDSDDTERRARMTQINRRVRELEHFLRPAMPIASQVALYFPREHYTQGNLKYPDIFTLTPLGTASGLPLDGWFGLLSHAGYPTGVTCDAIAKFPQDRVLVVPFTEFVTEQDWSALRDFSARGGRVILQLPIDDAGAAERVCNRLGLPFEEAEVRTSPLSVDGWTLVGADGKNAGAAHVKRVTLKDVSGPNVLARYYDNRRPALLELQQGRWLISTFDIGSSYDLTLRKELRKAVASWLERGGLKPRVKLEGVDEDYKPLVEVNVLEHEAKALLVCCNRSPYELDMTISVEKYRASKMKLPPFEARQEFTAASRES